MENYIVSARKYRPSTFRSVVGQRALTTTLKHAIEQNKLAHAYLFCGPRGVGKTSCARIFAKTINCLHPTAEGEACNECESCRAFNEQRSYNIHELDAASNNSVDDIRTLIDQVRIPPPIGKYKVFIIDEVHMLTTAAFNAFLKTLEEPPHHALFILATTEKHKVLPTILSRCQIYDFNRISIADIVEHLTYVASCEGVETEPEALNVIAQKADGGMRDALSIFDQVVSFTNGHITYQAVIDNLNVLDYEYYFRLTEAILGGNVRAALLILNEILSKGFDGQNFITGLASHFRDLLVCRDEATLVLFEVGASIRERYKAMAKQCADQLLFRAIELANSCDLNYKVSRNKRLLLELTLIQLCQLTQVEESKKKALIEPLAPTASAPATAPLPSAVSAQPTTPRPVTTTVPPTVQPPSQAVPPTTSSRPVVTPTPTAAPSEKRISRPMGLSLREMREGPSKPAMQSAPTATVREDLDTPFTEESLRTAWTAFAQRIEKEVHLKHTMLNCEPKLLDPHLFEVVVHNPAQQDELLQKTLSILSFIRKQLRNSHVQLRVRIEEGNKKQIAVTSAEKFALLLKINPALGKLKEEFDLKLD
ncbi:DNA polymerase III subunit gamma/tau [Parabacteroides distasonis]|nr:DNA polymerase III subunit gamma/tau [Parabacteroides distasonis]